MRVTLISKTFVAETAQRQLEWLARQPGVELTLITPPEWRSDHGRTLPFTPRFTEGYAVELLPIAFNGQYHYYFYRGLAARVRSLRPELVHIDEEPYNPAGAQAQRAAARAGARTVFVAWQTLFRAYPFPFSWMEQYDYRHTAHIIAGAAEAGEVVRRKGYTGPLSTFTLHGVDPALYTPQPRAPRTAPDAPFVVGYLGRLALYKGVGLLVEALAGLPAHIRLRFIGSGPDEPELRQLVAKHALGARVEFAGFVATQETPAALAGVDALAAPSLSQPNWKEQFGRVLIEAMSCEVPVIGSDSGEIPNVIGDAGLITPEGDVVALREAILRLAGDPAACARYARLGRARVLERFTQEQVARNIASVYAQVMSR